MSAIQICWGETTGIIVTGYVFQINFAQPFALAPNVIAIVNHTVDDGGEYIARLAGTATSYFYYYMYLVNGQTTNNPKVSYRAFGHWK